jgi:hypothetical protein
MTPLATIALAHVQSFGPMDAAQIADDLGLLRRTTRPDIPAFDLDSLGAVINELREAGRLERVAEGLRWLPQRESVGQGKLFT